MFRRFGNESTLIAQSGMAGLGAGVLVPGVTDLILIPKKVVLAGLGVGPADVKLISGESFLNARVPTDSTVCIPLGLELAKSSGITMNISGNLVQVTLYYTTKDESPGITKSASRAASLVPITTRNPGSSLLGDQS